MTAKQLKGRFIRKVMMHMLFQIGGAVVIIGALFKILHLEIGPLTGGVVLGLGLGTEAIIFLIGGLMLDDVREEQAEYEAYLTKGGPTAGGGSKDEGLSEKIDSLLKEAKMDVTLINSLTRSIKNLESSAQALTPASEAASSSQNYADQLEKATSQLKELNALYSQQAKDANSHSAYNQQVAENAEQLKVQMESLSQNLASINQVYKGMLSAMNKN